MKTLTLSAPAKLNLFLHINGRREDGYHELETLFTFLDFGDELAFTLTSNQQEIVICGDTAGIPLADNLIYKAAKILEPYKKIAAGVDIHLNKQLPMGGGVGGGSSDAATTLLALNTLWQCQLTIPELAKLGLQLGADVPVFVRGHTAFAEGVGEKITPVEVAGDWYLVVNPGIHVSTPAVFGEPDLPRDTAPIAWQDYTFEKTRNDCQQIVGKRHPEVAKLLQWLVHYAPSRMTGTGACVFATFSNEAAARTVQAKLPAHWTGFVARGVAQSPLKQQLHDVYAAPDRH